MKILIVSQYFWPESFRINDVALSLLARGCDVAVLTGQPNYPDGEIFRGYRSWKTGKQYYRGVAIYRVPLFPRGNASAFRLAVNYLSFILMACLFSPTLLRQQEFDVILVFGMSPILQAIPAIMLKKLRRRPLVTWVQDLWPESLKATGHVRDKRVLSMVGMVVNWIYRKNDMILVQSNAFINRIAPIAGNTPIAFHPNPGDSQPGTLDNSAGPALVLGSGFNVVFAGNLGTFQALDTLLDAAELLRDHPDVRFVLIGSGSRRAWLLGQVADRKLDNVHLAGRFEPAQIPPILAQASALLVSLVRNPVMALTIPSKVQTYLASGRPIIGALEGEGARLIVEAGAGVSCSAEDPQALAHAVLTVRAATLEERERMGENGQRYYAENFSPALLTERLIGHLHRACALSSPHCEGSPTGPSQ